MKSNDAYIKIHVVLNEASFIFSLLNQSKGLYVSIGLNATIVTPFIVPLVFGQSLDSYNDVLPSFLSLGVPPFPLDFPIGSNSLDLVFIIVRHIMISLLVLLWKTMILQLLHQHHSYGHY